jgi:hypothetical protein
MTADILPFPPRAAPPGTARFEVREVFHIGNKKHGGIAVIAGNILEGTVKRGMQARVKVDGALLSFEVDSVEFLDRISLGQTLVALLLYGADQGEASAWNAACPPGTAIELGPPPAKEP